MSKLASTNSRVALVSLCVVATQAFTADAFDATAIANDLRTRDCPKASPTTQRLRANEKLAAAAREVQRGSELRQALKRVGYRADESAVVALSGTLTAESLKRLLRKSYCDTLTDAKLTQIGVARTDRSLVLIIAKPFTPPAPGDATTIAKQVLTLVNEARAKSRRCGSERFASAAALTLDDRLRQAAMAHAKDMAKRDANSHRGSDGSAPADRVTRTGYPWRVVGENVASGQTTAAEVVQGWLNSPEHCKNIMDGDFTHMAVAYVVDVKQDGGIFWAQVFGRPR